MSAGISTDVRNVLSRKVRGRTDTLVEICSKLVRIPSETPPSDTREIAKVAGNILSQIDGVEVSYHTLEDPIGNVVARVKGKGAGKRLVFNGHLDTFLVGDKSRWTVDPFGAECKDGRIYGRGVADMKGGIACSMLAFMLLAGCRDAWSGELVIALAGDEEVMGPRGTLFLLDKVPFVLGDAAILGDIGTSKILRFGERGAIWFELTAVGKASHGAHVHRGINAIDRLISAMAKIREGIQNLPVKIPENVRKAVLAAGPVSEIYSGKGETNVLLSLTLNFGIIQGGIALNIMPDRATAQGDIRIPPGNTVEEVERTLKAMVGEVEGVSVRIIHSWVPNWSDPADALFSLISKNARQVWNEDVAVTMRVGSSDSRYFRLRGVPTVNCGLNGFNLGAADEYAEISDMVNVAEIHTLTAFDFLA